MAKLAFIGLGVMGFPMAGHLRRAGHDVTVFNRNAARATAWTREHGGQGAATPAEAANGAEIVFVCVGRDDDVRAVTTGPAGCIGAMAPGAILVDHTTTSAVLARELDAATKTRALAFVDAPVSGGQAGAEKGQLTVMCGGDPAAYARVEPVIAAYARMSRLLGAAGSGQLAKMVNQICIAGVVQGLAEGLAFATAAGLDGAAVVDVIAKGAAQSWQMENRYKTMLEGRFDFGFAVEWMRKDLGIALDEARRNGSQLPLTALVDQFYADVETMGGKRWDTSSLIARLKS